MALNNSTLYTSSVLINNLLKVHLLEHKDNEYSAILMINHSVPLDCQFFCGQKAPLCMNAIKSLIRFSLETL